MRIKRVMRLENNFFLRHPLTSNGATVNCCHTHSWTVTVRMESAVVGVSGLFWLLSSYGKHELEQSTHIYSLRKSKWARRNVRLRMAWKFHSNRNTTPHRMFAAVKTIHMNFTHDKTQSLLRFRSTRWKIQIQNIYGYHLIAAHNNHVSAIAFYFESKIEAGQFSINTVNNVMEFDWAAQLNDSSS